jgi:hypothetical protein
MDRTFKTHMWVWILVRTTPIATLLSVDGDDLTNFSKVYTHVIVQALLESSKGHRHLEI